MTTDREIVSIGMGDVRVSKQKPVTFCCVGLGSCIGFCAYDPIAKVGGMAHMVLPESGQNPGISPGKFVNTGIPKLFSELEKIGASRSRLQVKLCGGARMFSIPGINNPMDVGARNIDMANKVLAQEGVKSYRSDLGGNQGRTMSLFMDTGKVTVRTVGQGNVEL